jgi:DNA processing protein
MSTGCHELVRTAGAALVTDAADVLDLVGELGADAAPARRGEVRPHDGLDELTLRVLDALPVRQRAGPASLARVAGVAVRDVIQALAVLELRRLADCRDGAWRRATPRTGG